MSKKLAEWKARYTELMNEMPRFDDEDPDSPSGAITVNTAQFDVEELDDDNQPVAITATLSVDETEMGEPSSRKGGKGKAKAKSLKGSMRQPVEDFVKGM